MRTLACLFLEALLSFGCLADPDRGFDPNPKLNLRPENATGIPYWMYAWVGSYYNGTTTFRFSPMESSREDESVCDMFLNRTLTYSFPSLAAITEPDETNGNSDNPVMFLLKSWKPGFNLNPPDNTAARPEQINGLQWELESIEPPRHAYPFSGRPQWDLKLEEPAAMPFTVSGKLARPSGSVRSMQLNTSSCNLAADTWWGVNFLNVNATAGIPLADPSFRVQFDDKSANFQYAGYFRMNTDPGNKVLDNGDPKRSVLVGTVTVDFLGHIDAARSDVLVPNAHEPRWTPVIGWDNGTAAGAAENAGSVSRGSLGWIMWGPVVLGAGLGAWAY